MPCSMRSRRLGRWLVSLACFNTLSSSELERRREIGVLRSMGAIGRSVEAIFWTEAMVLWVFVAGDECAGYSGGGGLSCAAERVVAPIAFVYCPVPLLVILAFAVFIGSLASFIFVLEATRICVVEILRYE